jgi:hypothetical protein
MTKYRIAEIPLTGKFRVEYWVEPRRRFLLPDRPGFWACNFLAFGWCDVEFDSLEEARTFITIRLEKERKAGLPNIIHAA